MKRRKAGITGIICAALCASVAGVASSYAADGHAVAEDQPSDKNLVYRLDFSDENDRGKNSAGTLESAEIVADNGVTFTKNAIKGLTSFNVKNGGVRKNYAVIPGAVFDSETVTLAGWFKISGELDPFARMWEFNKNEGGSNSDFISVMPYHTGQHDGLNFCVKKSGAFLDNDENLFKTHVKDSRGVPTEYYLSPVYDAWVHYAYVISPNGVKYYQNGTLVKTVEKNMTARDFYGENSKLYLGATNMDSTVDFTGSFADIRVYASELDRQDIIDEYSLEYTDFLTTHYDFETGVSEIMRGYDGTLVNNATIGQDAERQSDVLILDGSGTRDQNNRTSFEIPSAALMGHSSITVSVDTYIDNLTTAYSYIAAFEADRDKHVLLAGKWASSDTLKLLCGLQGETNRAELVGNTPYNKWINITFTLDGPTSRAVLYIDGVPVFVNENCEYNNAIFWNARRNDYSGKCSFGKITFYNDKPFTGKLDNIKIFSTALTEKQVMMLHGITDIEDDVTAVKAELAALTVDYDGIGSKIDLPTRLGNGVTVEWSSSDDGVITSSGDVMIPNDGDKQVTLTATLKRGGTSMIKEFKLTVKSREILDPSVFSITALDKVRFTEGSYMEQLMKANFDFMMKLDPERLLYNYRLIAGLPTGNATSYGAWISTESDGAGQFEAHYVIALIKYCRSMPQLSHNGKSVLELTKYMVSELKKCQDAFAVLHPEHAGFLGGISTDDFDAMANNNGIRPDGKRVWVPWYIQHKQIEMLLDVYNYSPDADMKADAYTMLGKFADWCYNTMSKYNDEQRQKMLGWEYGGMAEALWQTYGLTKKTEHFKAAKYFEEASFLQNIKNNVDVLTGKHANTTIPKILGCAAAYEVTGNEDYKTMCVNAYDMIMTRTFANGSTSEGEHWRSPNVLDEGFETSETCCSYNMLKLADYLYRWTGNKKYADYAENVYTNHILASMAPDTGLKTYLTNTEFGYYKIYHTVDTTFWCCSCTGMENFAKLTQFIYYTSEDTLRVNMFYPSEIEVGDGLSVIQSGDFFTEQKTVFTVKGSGSLKLALRLPDWVEDATKAVIKINGQVAEATEQDGYFELAREWSDGDTVEYSLPFTYRFDTLKGHTRTKALFYGPLLYVVDLGSENVRDIRTDADRLNKGIGYGGNIGRKVVMNGSVEDACTVNYDDGEIYLYMETLNQGRLTFRPFNRVFHSRYAMYLDYYDSVEDTEDEYTIPDANEKQTEFTDEKSLNAFTQYSTDGRTARIENGKLVSPDSHEFKLMYNSVALGSPYVVETVFSSYRPNGAVDAGLYVLASRPENGLDMIKAYSVCISKTAGSDVATVNVFKFDHRYVGSVGSEQISAPQNGTFALHVFVTAEKILVFLNGSTTPVLAVDIDRSFITETSTYVGIRTFESQNVIDGFTVISGEFDSPDKALLNNAVVKAEAINISGYTSASADAFRTALTAAKSVLGDTAATQRSVNEANSALRKALGELVAKGDAAALKNAVTAAAALKAEYYTSESFARVTAALAEINKADLDDASADTVAELETMLKDAVFALVATATSTPEKPTAVDNSDNGGWKAAAITLICVTAAMAVAAGVYFIVKKRMPGGRKDGGK